MRGGGRGRREHAHEDRWAWPGKDACCPCQGPHTPRPHPQVTCTSLYCPDAPLQGSAEELQRLTEKLRQAVDASDLERQQAEDKAALAELLQQSSAVEEEQAAARGGGWEDMAGSGGGAERRRRARSPSLDVQGQEGSSYSSWDGVGGGQGEEGLGRRSVSPTEELRSGSRSPAAEDEEDDFNPFALTGVCGEGGGAGRGFGRGEGRGCGAPRLT